MNRALQIVTPPAVEPVLIGDVKLHLRILSAPTGGTIALAAAPNGVVRANGVVTVTPANGQPLPGLGQTVTLAGVGDATFNAGATVQTVDAVNGKFTFNQPGSNATSGGGTYQVTVADDEDRISALITAARVQAEIFTRRALITQTLAQYQDHFPHAGFLPLSPRSLYSHRHLYIRLFKAPLQSVSSIKYTDQNGVQQTMDPTTYVVDSVSEPARIGLAFGKQWPPIRVVPGSVVIQYVAGYGSTPASVPKTIQQAIMMLVAHWYENREVEGDGRQLPYTMGFENLLWGHRVLEF
jgi:uncharacterized phiE125 gp8 family phage protein